MHKQNAQNLVEFWIALGVVVIVAVVVLTALGKNVFGTYRETQEGFKTYKPFLWKKNHPSSNAKEVPQRLSDVALDEPVKACVNHKCSIDYGDFILEGIPEDFNEFIKDVGASGGTNEIVSLIEQLADNLEVNDQPKEAEEIRQLANLGHNLAILENYAETIVNQCNMDQACIQDKFTSPMVMPVGYNETVSPFPKNITYEELCETIFDVGRARNYRTENPETYEQNLSSNSLAYLFVDKYDTIANNPNISSVTKGILQELYWDIGVISEDFDNNLEFVIWGGSEEPSSYFDPDTGQVSETYASSNPLSDFENYDASKITHFDSALICGSGRSQDSGTSCH